MHLAVYDHVLKKDTDHERFPQQQPQKEKVWFTFGESVNPEKINGTKIRQLPSHAYLFVSNL